MKKLALLLGLCTLFSCRGTKEVTQYPVFVSVPFPQVYKEKYEAELKQFQSQEKEELLKQIIKTAPKNLSDYLTEYFQGIKRVGLSHQLYTKNLEDAILIHNEYADTQNEFYQKYAKQIK